MHCLHAIHWTHQQLCTQCLSTIAIDCARDERIMHFFVNWSPLQALKNNNPYYRMPWVLPTRTAPAIAAHGLVRAINWSTWRLSTRWKLANKGCQFVKESGKTNIGTRLQKLKPWFFWQTSSMAWITWKYADIRAHGFASLEGFFKSSFRLANRK